VVDKCITPRIMGCRTNVVRCENVSPAAQSGYDQPANANSCISCMREWNNFQLPFVLLSTNKKVFELKVQTALALQEGTHVDA
jgi:hypothetical protein